MIKEICFIFNLAELHQALLEAIFTISMRNLVHDVGSQFTAIWESPDPSGTEKSSYIQYEKDKIILGQYIHVVIDS